MNPFVRSDRIRAGRRVLLWVAGCLLIAGCSVERADVRTPGGEPPEADTTRVRRAVYTIAEAFESGDVSALDTLYHDSVLVYESGRVERGWASYRDRHLLPEIRVLAGRELRIEDVHVHLEDGMAWATFRYELNGVRRADTLSARGVGTMVFRKIGGGWRVIHAHTSAEG